MNPAASMAHKNHRAKTTMNSTGMTRVPMETMRNTYTNGEEFPRAHV